MSYAMFSKAGDREVQRMVDRVVKMPLKSTDKEILKKIAEERNKIEKKGHLEVFDTEVEECFMEEVRKLTGRSSLSRFDIPYLD